MKTIKNNFSNAASFDSRFTSIFHFLLLRDFVSPRIYICTFIGNSVSGRPTSSSSQAITSGLSLHAVDGNIASCFTLKSQKVRNIDHFYRVK